MNETPTQQALATAQRALRCLYIAVSEDVARDVNQACNAALVALERQVAGLERERMTLLAASSDWLQRYNDHSQTIAEQAKRIEQSEKAFGELTDAYLKLARLHSNP